MRILVISNLFPPNVFGGAETLLANLVEVLLGSHDVRVLTTSSDHPYPQYVLPMLAIDVPYPRAYQASLSKRLRVAVHNARTTREVIESVQPDVVLVSDLKRISLAPILESQKLLPTAVFLHDVNSLGFIRHREGPFQNLTTIIDKLTARSGRITLDFVIANSRNTIKAQRSELAIKEHRVIGVGIQVPLDLFALIQHTTRDSRRIAYLGRIEREKGVHTIVEALGLLKKGGRNDLYLEIAGYTNDREYLAYLRDSAKAHGVDGSVRIIGKLSDEEKYRFLASAGQFVFASTWEEGHGQTYLEAMLCETPCICTAAGGAAEVLRDRVNCLLFDPADPKSLAQAIQELFATTNLQQRIVASAKAMVLERFTRNRFASRLESALNDCIIAFHGSNPLGNEYDG